MKKDVPHACPYLNLYYVGTILLPTIPSISETNIIIWKMHIIGLLFTALIIFRIPKIFFYHSVLKLSKKYVMVLRNKPFESSCFSNF